jgi:hypothetical protein
VVNVLLDAEASIDYESREGQTALMAAAMADKGSTVELMLRRGANVDKETTKGLTVLKVSSSLNGAKCSLNGAKCTLNDTKLSLNDAKRFLKDAKRSLNDAKCSASGFSFRSHLCIR